MSGVIVRLWLAVFAGYLALGSTLQELPGYLGDRFGSGSFMVGTAIGLAFLGTAAGRPIAGRAGDVGHSRTGGAIGGALTAVAAVGHLVAPNIALLIVARIVMGLGEAALFSATLPRVLASAPPGAGGRVSGWFGLSMWSGLSLGPLAAVGLNAAGGSDAVWAAVIALPTISTLLILSTPRRDEAAGAGHPRPAMPAGIAAPGAIIGLAAYGYGTLTAVLLLFLDDIGGRSLGLFVFSATFLLTRATGSPLVDRIGGGRVARAVLVLESAGFALLAVTHAAPVALAAVAVTGVGLGLVYPATTKMTLAQVPAAGAGLAVGVMTSCWDAGILVAGPLSGAIAEQASFAAAFAAAAALALGGFVVAVLPAARPGVAHAA